MKYNDPYVREVILRVISRTGSQQTAYQAACISESTFYEWMQKPEFSEAVHAARRTFAKSDLDKIEETFRQKIIAAMTGVTEVHESEETTTLPDGTQVTKHSKRSIKKGPAKWAFDLVAPAISGNFGVVRENKDVTSGGERISVIGFDVIAPALPQTEDANGE